MATNSLQDGRNGVSEQFLWVGSTDFSKWISDDSSTLFSADTDAECS
jgi:hypothetical protein